MKQKLLIKWQDSQEFLRTKGLEFAGLLFAFFAFLFSIKSCNDSNYALDISRKQSMAFVQIVDAELVEPIDSASIYKIKLTLKNLGQIPARNVKVEFDFSVQIGDFKSDGNPSTRKEIGSIGQGFEKIVIIQSNKRDFKMWNINKRIPDVMYFYGTVFYKDNLNDTLEKKEDWCYELKLDSDKVLKTKKLNQSESSKFKSTYHQPNQ
jgi:hypothetical protein